VLAHQIGAIIDYRSIFSAISLIAVFVYIYIGLYSFNHNRKSKINRVFLLLCASYAVWSFAYAFAYLSNNYYVFSIWNKISAVGWCSFSAITLYLVLLIIENKFVKYKLVKVFIFSPAFIFLYMAIFLFGVGIHTSPIIEDIFYIGDFLYNFIYLLTSIILILFWGIKTESRRIKIQSKILIISSSVPFLLNLLTQNILPILGYKNFPLMGQLYAMVMIIGTYIVIERYKFLKIPIKVVLEEVENRIIDMIIVVNEKCELIKISKHTLAMLGYQESELLNKNIALLFDLLDKEKFTVEILKKQELNYHDIGIIMKNGNRIPVNIHSMPLWDKKVIDFLGAAIIMQDISIEYELRRKNEELYQINIKDGLTNLYNHQYSFEIISEELKKIKEIKGLKQPNELGGFHENEDTKTLFLMMLDIDYFKRVNDTYGHLFGDYVLKTLAGILVEIISDNGYVGRFGGEEFIIILPNIDLDRAYELGENIRLRIANYKYENNLKVTVSIGLNQYKNQLSIDFIKEADDLLYKAKENGRNRIEI